MNIIDSINKNNISLYKISKDTGIPYMTINDIFNNKTFINKCTFEVVYKLSIYLNCDINDIINKNMIYNNITGIYKKIKYKYQTIDDKICLFLIDKNKTFKVDEKTQYCVQNPYLFTKLYAETFIDDYCEKKELENYYEKLYTNA